LHSSPPFAHEEPRTNPDSRVSLERGVVQSALPTAGSDASPHADDAGSPGSERMLSTCRPRRGCRATVSHVASTG
jgi:hypothetical protein